MCVHPQVRVADCWDGEDWNIPFRRSLATFEKDCLDMLLLWLRLSPLDVGQDNIICALENSKSFSTKSLYSFMTNRGVILKYSNSCWKARIPLKIKIFLWQLSNDRLQTGYGFKMHGLEREPPLLPLWQTGERRSHLLQGQLSLGRVRRGVRLGRSTRVSGGFHGHLA